MQKSKFVKQSNSRKVERTGRYPRTILICRFSLSSVRLSVILGSSNKPCFKGVVDLDGRLLMTDTFFALQLHGQNFSGFCWKQRKFFWQAYTASLRTNNKGSWHCIYRLWSTMEIAKNIWSENPSWVRGKIWTLFRNCRSEATVTAVIYVLQLNCLFI